MFKSFLNLSAIALSLLAFACTQKNQDPVLNDKGQTNQFQVVENEADAKKMAQKAADVVEVSDMVFFDFDSSKLNDEAKKTLDNQVKWLKQEKKIKVLIAGHCDERGTREYNIALGQRRANAVKQYLISQGVESKRVSTKSFGKEKPLIPGSTEEAWAKNRRAVTTPKI